MCERESKGERRGPRRDGRPQDLYLRPQRAAGGDRRNPGRRGHGENRRPAKREDKPFVTFDCAVVNQHGQAVVTGQAEIMAPTEKQTVQLPELPAISVGD